MYRLNILFAGSAIDTMVLLHILALNNKQQITLNIFLRMFSLVFVCQILCLRTVVFGLYNSYDDMK